MEPREGYPEETGEDILAERRALAAGRLEEMLQEQSVPAPFDSYFRDEAACLLRVLAAPGSAGTCADDLGAQLLPGNYETSWTNPAYACSRLGKEHGRVLCFLAASLAALPAWRIGSFGGSGMEEAVTVHCELFIEIRGEYAQEELPQPEQVRQTIYWFVSDYQDLFAAARVRQMLEPDPAAEAALYEAAADPAGLWRFGEVAGREQKEIAAALAEKSEEEIAEAARRAADAFLQKIKRNGEIPEEKTAAGIDFPVGACRLAAGAARELSLAGLKPVICRQPHHSSNIGGPVRTGFYGGDPNPQFTADHAQDDALYLDARYVRRREEVLETAYRECAYLADGYAGTLSLEIPGSGSPAAVPCPEAIRPGLRAAKPKERLREAEERLAAEYVPGPLVRWAYKLD